MRISQEIPGAWKSTATPRNASRFTTHMGSKELEPFASYREYLELPFHTTTRSYQPIETQLDNKTTFLVCLIADLLSGVKNHPHEANERNRNLQNFIFPIHKRISFSGAFLFFLFLRRRNTRPAKQFRSVRLRVTDPSAVRFRSQGANSNSRPCWVTGEV